MGGTGTVTSAIAFGREDPYPPTGANPDNLTELWNGTNWTEVNNLSSGRSRMGAAGADSTSALSVSGLPASPGVLVEQWNGTNWTEVNDLNDGRWGFAGNGTVTSALAYGGIDGPTTNTANTESWNGTNWTEVNNLNDDGEEMGTAGTQTSALAVAGYGRPGVCESWNGTNWTEVNDLNTARSRMGAAGTVPSALGFGGQISTAAVSALTEEWNGSSWTEVADLNTARGYATQTTGSNNTSAIVIGGTSPDTANTEIWNGTVQVGLKQQIRLLFV